MLTLTRKHMEGITLKTSDGDIKVYLVRQENRTKFVVDAPEQVLVLRNELIARKLRVDVDSSAQ